MLEIKVTVDIPQLNDVCAMLAGQVAMPQVYKKPEYVTEEIMPGVARKVRASADAMAEAPAIVASQAQTATAPAINTQQVPVTAVPVQMPTGAPAQQAAPMPTVTPQPMAEAPSQPVPTAALTYTVDQLAIAATQLMDAGRKDDVVSLLAQFGVQALTLLPKEQYGAFATRLRELGAKL